MGLYTGEIEWHDLRIDPDDLPGEEEPIITTLECANGEDRKVWLDAYLKYDDNGDPIFCTKTPSVHTNFLEESAIWYPVIAWAYPPSPFNAF